ncbi:MAG: hypothetical protein JW746_08030 [Candidatus Krumholzibacteriota bacterium]|nr:hypothetical protein [Candidatus Krumholzibacteriota bacterium]
MKDQFTRLTEKTEKLGNYNHKYLHVISKSIDRLTAALERDGVRDRVHLWSYSLEISAEMDTILQVAGGRQEALDFLGCYYALQFLHMNLRMIDIVKLEIASSRELVRISRKFMLESGRMFRFLTRDYMKRLLDLFLEGKDHPEFVVLGVGTRADQDDIDLGIVYSGAGDVENLNHAIGQLSSQMFKTATRLHFHLSEYIGGKSLSASIEEYEEVLDNNVYNFIIVSEMIGAANILGSHSLFEEFKKRVTDRFYFDPENSMNRFHEGFLRGILGEIKSVLSSPKSKESINPKEDALRSIRGLLSALKLVYGIEKLNAWEIIDELKTLNPEREKQYDDIERTLSFFELFRHLYQIMVAQDEEITLSEPCIAEMVAVIAEMLGFEDRGVVTAEDFMLVDYYNSLEDCYEAIGFLSEDLKNHLRGISVYRPIFSGDRRKSPGYKGNLAVDFLRASSFSEGITYWDDFLEELNGETNLFYDEFVESFRELPESLLKKVARGYISNTVYEPTPILRFLTVLGKKAATDESRKIFDLLSGIFIDQLSELPSVSDSLSRITSSQSGTLNNFLALLDYESLGRFISIIEKEPAIPELLPYHKRLLSLSNIHYQSSHFFKRHFHSILNKYPVFIKNLYNDEKLKEITKGFYSDITSLPTIERRIERIGDYYDMEFVRVSLLTLAGAGSGQTDAEFTEFCDNYTHALHEYCQQDIHRSLGYSIYSHDMFALYATGGHAREQGFDDDYDMIAILDSSDDEIIYYCNKIVTKMNSQILKRGILPHHRLSEQFGSYVISLDQLAEFLSGDIDSVLVELSQILGSRMLVGTKKLGKKLMEDIIVPFIFERDSEFIELLIEEMVARHALEDEEIRRNIKECRGGQRDIEMLLLIYKARYKFRDPLSARLFGSLSGLDPARRDDFSYLEEHLKFIKNLRDLYRLKVAAHDVIEVEYLPEVASSMGYGAGSSAAERLFGDFISRTDRAMEVIIRLMAGIWS